jgi:hypothetical protein
MRKIWVVPEPEKPVRAFAVYFIVQFYKKCAVLTSEPICAVLKIIMWIFSVLVLRTQVNIMFVMLF